MPPPERDLSKLPKWARQEIERLRADLAYTQEKLSAGPADSDTFADPYSNAPRPLGCGTAIEFRFGNDWSQKFQARLIGDKLQINAGNTLVVFPHASNVVSIGAG